LKLSTRTRYGCRAMLELALHHGKGEITLKEIASRQEISAKYLDQILAPLRAAGLVRSIRGPRGGYILAKDPSTIRLCDIVHVLEGSLAPSECVDAPELCHRSGFCVTREVWKELKDRMDDVLGSRTLSDLVDRQRSKLEDLDSPEG